MIDSEELNRIVSAYRDWRSFDSDHAPSAAAKKQLRATASAAGKLRDSLARLDDHARRHAANRLGAKLLTDGPTALLEFTRALSAVEEASTNALGDLPRDWSNTAARMAADSLRAAFKHRGLDFSATFDDYGNASPAVTTLVDVARRAGDSSMTLAAARKWVEHANKQAAVRMPPATQNALGKRSSD